MSKLRPVVFDIDGVLADFMEGFTTFARQYVNQNIVVMPTIQHQAWDHYSNMTSEEVKKTWKLVDHYPGFWLSLSPIVSERTWQIINALSLERNVYFATNRSTERAKMVSEEWLRCHGIENPTVVTTKLKGEFCRLVEAEYAIDDKSENAWCIAWLSPKTKSFVVDRPYNQYATKVGSSKILRVGSVDTFLEHVEVGNIFNFAGVPHEGTA